jgi:hypothetical protein
MVGGFFKKILAFSEYLKFKWKETETEVGSVN